MTSIPKFASFRPKQPPPSATAAPAPVRDKHEQDRKKGHHHRRHRSRSRSRERKNKELLEVQNAKIPPKDEVPELFVIDRKGDPKNLIYGGNHRYDIPTFHRAGAGNVLGAPSNMRIDRDQSNDKALFLAGRGHTKFSSRERYVFSKIDKERPRLLKIRPEIQDGKSTKPEVDFISLGLGRGRKRPRREENSSSDEDGNDYRSIHGKLKASNQPADEDLEFVSDSDVSDTGAGRVTDLDPFLSNRSIELSRQVEHSPHDISAWLSLIEHQDTLINSGSQKRRITSAEVHSTADIKIHMYEKALEKVKSLQDRERLLLGMMAEGSKIWDVQVQSEKWEQISKDNIQSVLLWKSYLDFKQTNFSTFQHGEIREVFLKRLNVLNENIHRPKVEATDALYHQALYVLLRMTIYLRESGYSELAIAIWQGLLEFNFWAPLPQNTVWDQAHKLALFKEFWESEVPRIGEEGALGWRNFAENSGSSEPPDAISDDDPVNIERGQLFKNWAIAESLRAKTSLYPARTMDEVAEDDPFRVILLSDIENYLMSFPSSKYLHGSLIDAFLLFCGLPPSANDTYVRIWSSDPFIVGGNLDLDANRDKFLDVVTLLPEVAETKEQDITTICNSYPAMFAVSHESMFGCSWFKSTSSWQEENGGNNGPVAYNWVRSILSRLAKVYLYEEFAEYYLAFEWRNESSHIKKVAKLLLKLHSSSLRLYNAYGLIEWERGNKELAVEIFSAALSIGKTMPKNESDTIKVWQSWIWKTLDAGNKSTALKLLLSVADGSPNDSITNSPAILLKSKQFFSTARDYSLSNGDFEHAMLHAELLALLQYLTSTSRSETQSITQGDVSSALSVYKDFSQVLQDRNQGSSTTHELFLQSATRLLYHHAQSGPFRPALLRDHLAGFLILFPKNTIFLSLYTFNESRLRIENRVRSILNSTVLIPENDSLVSRFFSIKYEVSHGTIHAVRSAFEHAISSPACKGSISLWKFYIIFCAQHFQSQVKDVWYRALRACPWGKDLYILGFRSFEPSLEFEELKGTWKVMGEKDLRVHVDLEDIFDDIVDLRKEQNIPTRKLGFKG